jgi:hypothetical protein
MPYSAVFLQFNVSICVNCYRRISRVPGCSSGPRQTPAGVTCQGRLPSAVAYVVEHGERTPALVCLLSQLLYGHVMCHEGVK